VKNLEKRRKVMERSMRLGHCICDPKTPCPCDRLKEQDLCPCAGERPEPPAEPVRLTRLVEKAGCASKIDQAALKRILGGLPSPDDPRVLVGMPAGDDAGVFRYDGNRAWVQTVDVFSPSVDDPYLFGQVAAANSVSDIYAMGGTPLTALSIIGFPIREVPDSVMRDILRGGIDKMAEAGVAVIGGHSIQDKEIKAGFAVTGLIDTDKIVTNAGAKPGDVLVLTRPIGTGIIAFAAQIDRAPAEAIQAAARSMTTLNKTAAELMLEYGAHACTDITGFGLMGHLTNMAASSSVDVEIIWDQIPLLPSVLECAAAGIIPGAVERNRESCPEGSLTTEGLPPGVDALPPAVVDICFDPQTSGGLLVALPEQKATAFLARLQQAGLTDAAIIGQATNPGTGRIHVRTDGTRCLPAPSGADALVGHSVRAPGRKDSHDLLESAGSSPQSSLGEPRGLSPWYYPEQANNEPGAPSGSPSQPEGSSPQSSPTVHDETKELTNMADRDVPCCADAVQTGPQATSGLSEAQKKYHEFLKTVNQPGALDAHTKQAIAIALSVANRCEPCLKMHLQKAKDKGFSQAEIDEAAWMAISFGGSPLMVWYDKVKKA
jgi:selenide, water dikinase